MTENQSRFDSVLVIAFGGPEKLEDVRPFLMSHYELFGGKSPVNEVTLLQAQALKATLKNQGKSLAVYTGMRNWHPLLVDTVRQMSRDGANRAVGLIMSVYQSKSSWDQYQTDVANAIARVGVNLSVEYTGPLFDHPGFIEAASNQVKHCLEQLLPPDRQTAHILFTAHSLPYSDPKVELYAKQVDHAATSVARKLDRVDWQLAYQSRSGRPQDPWLEPDVNVVLRELGAGGVKHVVAVPIGFVCDNIEVLYDLDIQAMETARQAGITLLRAKTVGDDRVFVNALADLVKKVLAP
jgi:ferrochelatase